MTRDLDTLLDEAVATTPVDTTAVLSRARTLRRRRTAGRAVATLAALAVVGTGLTLAVEDRPLAPIVGSDPSEVEVEAPAQPAEALAPVLPVTVVDPSLPLLRVDVEVDEVPAALDLGRREDAGADGLAPMAVGPDGTWVAVTARSDQLIVGGAGRPPTAHDVAGTVVLAAVLPDGAVLAGVGTAFDAPVDRLVHVADGVLSEHELAVSLDVTDIDDRLIVQDARQLSFAVRDGDLWRELVVWTVTGGVQADGQLQPVALDRTTVWTRVDRIGDGTSRSRIGVASGMVLEVGRSDRSDEASGRVWSEHIVGGRRVEALGWSELRGDPVSVIGVLGPDLAAAVVPVRLPAHEEGWMEVAEPLLSVDGALWLRARDGSGVVRIVPPGQLPTEPASPDLGPGPQLPLASLAPTTPRAPAQGPMHTVVAAGAVGEVPDEVLDGVLLHDALPRDCCWRPAAASPDGMLALWGDPLGDGASRVGDLLELSPVGASSRIAVGSLYGAHGTEGPSVAFDASGNLWGLADRWWSHAGFPDLVVRRAGERSFTSLGHLPLDDLLGTDAGRVRFHVEGDEVALVGTTTDAAGREVLAGRVVVARDGQAVTAEERVAAALPGPSLAITSGNVGPVLRTGTIGDARAASLSGPFLGATVPAGIEHGTGALGWPHRTDLIGGLVVADAEEEATDTTTVLVGDRSGAMAAVRVAGRAEPLAAADGTLWAVVEGRGFVRLLDADWQPAGRTPDGRSASG